ncbi:hypothetical protein [Microbacterium sp.]|uniref:hypothetical protein n=1 Tax=Microbacterium sp. TaxID=51671 RepID=UPI002733DFD4|nr:hypothetical protein [Microbacterium sp.]MDP3949512.1 hypothetical protein [Microbacterium sp.]
MNRKIPALAALSLAALIPLSGCAAEQTPLNYLKGTWECSDGSKHSNYDPGTITMRFDGELITLESDNDDADAFLPDLVLGEHDGYTSVEAAFYYVPLLLDLPEVIPTDGSQIEIPMGSADSGISPLAHYVATVDGNTFTLAMINISDGYEAWSSGMCVKQ